MLEVLCNVAVPQTSQELDLAIQQYQASNESGMSLFCQWQAIRDASLEQGGLETETDQVPGQDSY